MSKLTLSIGKEGSEKEYIMEFTRENVCKAETTYDMSLLQVPKQFETLSKLDNFLHCITYAGLLKNQPKITKDDVTSIYNELVGEDGYDEQTLVEGIVALLESTLNPKSGGRKKFPKAIN